MEIVIVGGGAAGAAAARALALLTKVARVTVLERASSVGTGGQPALGLWPRSWSALTSLLGNGGVAKLDALAAPPACYRDQRGAVLSHCSHTDANSTAVQTVRTEVLVRALLDHPAIDVHTAVDVVSAGSCDGGARGRVCVAGGAEIEADAVVIAAGSQWGKGATDDATIVTVGAVLENERVLDADALAWWSTRNGARGRFQTGRLPYETLAPGGRRFAVVPLSGSSLFWFATLAPSDVANGEEASAASVVRRLPQLFDGVSTPLDRAIVDHAASSAGEGSELLQRVVAAPAAPSPWSTSDAAVFRVGEASNAAGHSLAQGASLAIEDAVEFSRALGSVVDTDGMGLAWPPNFAAALLNGAWEEARRTRITRHHFMTSLLQRGAACPDGLASVRNAVLRLTPSSISTRVFDAALGYSLNDGGTQ